MLVFLLRDSIIDDCCFRSFFVSSSCPLHSASVNLGLAFLQHFVVWHSMTISLALSFVRVDLPAV